MPGSSTALAAANVGSSASNRPRGACSPPAWRLNQRQLRIGHDPLQLRSVRIGAGIRLGQQRLQLANKDQTPVDLRLKEENRVGDGLDLGGGQLIDQLGMHNTRPRPTAKRQRPTANVGDTFVVNRDDRDLIRWLTVGAGAGEVVETTFEQAKKSRWCCGPSSAAQSRSHPKTSRFAKVLAHCAAFALGCPRTDPYGQ